MAGIKSKKELSFYIKADRMINQGSFQQSFGQKIQDFFFPDYIMRYLSTMRKLSYYHNSKGCLSKIMECYYRVQMKKLGLKLNFSIGPDVLGYGVRIPHYGTIVVGDKNTIGNYAVLHTSICITSNDKNIGDALYVSTGAKITTCRTLGNNVTIAANSVVTRSIEDSNVMLAGMPAVIKKKSLAWYIEDAEYARRVNEIEKLKLKMKI